VTGDPCHHNIRGFTKQQARKFFKNTLGGLKASDCRLCQPDGSDIPFAHPEAAYLLEDRDEEA